MNKPNVILFFGDTVKKDMVGCYGGDIPTPNMDRLAAEGIKFHCAQPNSPVCSPARYNLLTGRDTSRCTGFQDLYTEADPVFSRWNVYIKEGEDTLFTLYNDNGYKTGAVGKWHLGEPVFEPYTDYDNKENPETLAKVAANYNRARDYVKKVSGAEYVESLFSNNELAIPMPKDMTCQHNQHWITEGALNFIEENADNPFFLMVTPNLPHNPHVLDTLESNSTLTPSGYLDKIPDVQPHYSDILNRLEDLGFPKECEHMGPEWLKKDRHAGVMWLDDGLGAILDKLDQLGLSNDTIIAFTTDHLERGKLTVNQQYLPLMIRYPGKIAAGIESDALVSHVDLISTLVDMSKVENNSEVGIDGKSFTPVLTNPEMDWNYPIYSEVTYTRGVFTKEWNYIATRFPQHITDFIKSEERQEFSQEGTNADSTRFKADKHFPGYFDNDQLYDLTNDKNEQINLAHNPEYSTKLAEMKQLLSDRIAEYPFSFGELKQPQLTKPYLQRGQRAKHFLCKKCLHLAFNKKPGMCPVCGALEHAFERNDAILYASEEKWAENVKEQIPVISWELNDSLTINIANPGHPMTALNYICFYDIYRGNTFYRRVNFLTDTVPEAEFNFAEIPESITVIAYSSYYGYMQRELVIK